MMTGGLIFKVKEDITNEKILETLKRQVRSIPEPETFEFVLGATFHGVAIARKENIIFVFGRDITHSCSFEPYEQSKLDERLEQLPGQPGIVCFLINSVSETYALSLFLNGQRLAGKSAADGVLVSDFSFGDKNLLNVPMNEDGILEFIKQFSGCYLPDLTDDRETYIQTHFE